MPFKLKFVEATYQRAMVILLHDMMHKEVKVYVDDMIIDNTHFYTFIFPLICYLRVLMCLIELI